MAYTYLRGESLRINGAFGDSAGKISLETGCKLSIGTGLEDESTKDDTDNGWDNQSVSTKNWNVSADAKIKSDGSNAAALLIKFIDQTAKQSVTVSLPNSQSLSGNALLTQLDIDAQVKQTATLSLTLTGVGALS